MAATGTVTTQAYIILRNRFQSTAELLAVDDVLPFSSSHIVDFLITRDLVYPTNTTEPTLQCVVEIGKPILLANKTVIAAPISIVNPL